MAAESEERVAAFVDARSAALGYADPGERFRDERPDALMSVERKGVEPLAAVTAPDRMAAQHRSSSLRRSG